MVGSEECFNSTGMILSIFTLNCLNHVLNVQILAVAPLEGEENFCIPTQDLNVRIK